MLPSTTRQYARFAGAGTRLLTSGRPGDDPFASPFRSIDRPKLCQCGPKNLKKETDANRHDACIEKERQSYIGFRRATPVATAADDASKRVT